MTVLQKTVFFSRLRDLGFEPGVHHDVHEAVAFAPDQRRVGRVIEVQKGLLQVSDGENSCWCVCGGKAHFLANSAKELPTVGDFVVFVAEKMDEFSRGRIDEILPRKTLLARAEIDDGSDVQLLAANVDYVGIVTSFNRDFNPRRLERYMTLAWESGAVPFLIINKLDLQEDRAATLEQAETVAQGTRVFAVSAATGEGLSELIAAIPVAKTFTLLGSSGVGKSTLLNCLAGETRQQTAEIRSEDDRGRHTTTHRSLVRLPSGILVIDTPGMRELGVASVNEGGGDAIDHAFREIVELELRCKFTGCSHRNEPGCMVQQAIAAREIEQERLDSYRKLQRELAYMARKTDKALASQEKQKWKAIHKGVRQKKRFEEG